MARAGRAITTGDLVYRPSGSGKSAIAKRAEQALHVAGRQTYSLTPTTYGTGYAMTSASPSLTRWKNP